MYSNPLEYKMTNLKILVYSNYCDWCHIDNCPCQPCPPCPPCSCPPCSCPPCSCPPCPCPLALFLNKKVSNFARFLKNFVDKFKKKDMLEKKFCSNVVPNAGTGLQIGHQRGNQGAGQIEGWLLIRKSVRRFWKKENHHNLKGMFTKNYLHFNLIFWGMMGCGIAQRSRNHLNWQKQTPGNKI